MNVQTLSILTKMTSLRAMPKQTPKAQRKLIGSLQDQLLSVSGPYTEVAKCVNTDFGVGLPPLYAKEDAALEPPLCKPKVIGSRVISWTYLGRSNKAA
jgi:hypothetical protein